MRAGKTASARAPRPLRRDERWLSTVWERQTFDRRQLRTTSGQAFKIVFPGVCTGEAGPDFHDAILALADGSLLRGDVELHLESSGWRQHGHQQDPAYERVLLHVVLREDEPALNSAGERVSTLELAGRLGPVRAPEPANDLPGQSDPPAGGAQLSYVVAPCQRALPRAGVDGVRTALTSLALERFNAKQTVFEGELAVFEPDQVLYTGLMEALGYSRNRAPFRQLAQLVPVAAVRCAATAERIEALLLTAAGLSGAGSALLAQAGLAGEPLPSGCWTVVGVRPENAPARRIGQLGLVLARLLTGGLVDKPLPPLLEAEVAQAGDAGAPELRRVWLGQLAELGTQRSDAIAVNVLLPFAAAYGQATCQFMLSEAATQVFLRYPAEGGNQITRYMRRDILGTFAGVAMGAAGEQALIHVWDHWCHEKVCSLCPLGTKSLARAASQC